jgi:hypothetical protein
MVLPRLEFPLNDRTNQNDTVWNYMMDSVRRCHTDYLDAAYAAGRFALLVAVVAVRLRRPGRRGQQRAGRSRLGRKPNRAQLPTLLRVQSK